MQHSMDLGNVSTRWMYSVQLNLWFWFDSVKKKLRFCGSRAKNQLFAATTLDSQIRGDTSGSIQVLALEWVGGNFFGCCEGVVAPMLTNHGNLPRPARKTLQGVLDVAGELRWGRCLKRHPPSMCADWYTQPSQWMKIKPSSSIIWLNSHR